MPRNPFRALGLASLLLTNFACASESSELSSQPLLASVGESHFRQYCASCHGVKGRGDGPAAAALRSRPADLTRIAARRDGSFPEAEIAGYIDGRFELGAHGTREMPIWGQRFQERFAEGTDPDEVVRGRLMVLVEYLKTIQRPD